MNKNVVNRIIILIVFLFAYTQGRAQFVYTPEDSVIVMKLMDKIKADESLDALPAGARLAKVGLKMAGTVYRDKKNLNVPDTCVLINFRRMDCVTFVENMMAVNRVTMMGHYSFEAYKDELRRLRYRKGEKVCYYTRLHYFSDFLYDNSVYGALRDISFEAGGEPYVKKTSYMTDNPDRYPLMQRKQHFIDEMKKVEAEISKRKYYYIPKGKIGQLEGKIEEGDIIAITASRKNLDMLHTGLAVKKNGRIYLLHASSIKKKVMVTDKSLHDYLQGFKSASGIMIFRAL